METYREKLKAQNIFILICITILLAFSALNIAAECGVIPFGPSVGDSHWQAKWRGFCTGASLGLLALLIYGLIANLRALKNEKHLRKLFIKEHDERTQKICTAARSSGTQVFLILGLVAIIIAGYFSVTVSITIMGCVLSLSLICVILKLYYGRKF